MPDYINREEAIKAFMGQPPEAHYPAWYAALLRTVPPVDIKVIWDRNGLWMEDDYGYSRCSECCYELNHPGEKTPFCPGCGANMEPDLEEATAHNRDCKLTRHKAICDGIHDLYERKNHDYGDSFGQSFRDHGILAGVIRIEDKFNRLKTLAGGAEQKVQDESIRDTLRDMANYAIMTLLEMEGDT